MLHEERSHSAAIFSATFRNEYRRFDHFTRYLETGKASYGNTKNDWYGVAAFSTGSAVINTAISVLAAIGVITGLVSIGLALGMTLLGIGVNIVFNIYQNNAKRKEYQCAVQFIEKEKMKENIKTVKLEIMQRFSSYLAHCSAHEARQFAKKTHTIIADAVIRGKIKTLSELTSPTYMAKYEKAIARPKPSNTHRILHFFQKLTSCLFDRWRHRKNNEIKNTKINVRHGFFSTKGAVLPSPVIESLAKPIAQDSANVVIPAKAGISQNCLPTKSQFTNFQKFST